MQNGDPQLIDRKTLFKISQSGQHPFTREAVTVEQLEELNIRSDLVARREDIIEKLDRLYNSIDDVLSMSIYGELAELNQD
jgi:hypothetical protein